MKIVGSVTTAAPNIDSDEYVPIIVSWRSLWGITNLQLYDEDDYPWLTLTLNLEHSWLGRFSIQRFPQEIFHGPPRADAVRSSQQGAPRIDASSFIAAYGDSLEPRLVKVKNSGSVRVDGSRVSILVSDTRSVDWIAAPDVAVGFDSEHLLTELCIPIACLHPSWRRQLNLAIE